MNINERLNLVRQVGEEIVSEEELIELFNSKQKYIAYDGFEPSGRLHIAQGLLRAINVNKMIDSGAEFKMLVADWHAWANNKMGGDLDKIQTIGKYMIEVWRASGMNLDHVEFIWFSEKMVSDPEYWKIVMKISRESTLKRIIRCGQIMGRQEGEVQQASQILYPCMQAADIFYLNADVAQLGVDQRKVNMLAREVAPKLGLKKPIVVSHKMLAGLKEPPKTDTNVDRMIAMKMSKSQPNTAIFMDDDEKSVIKKINKAYCPEAIVKDNPVLEYSKYIIFPLLKTMAIERPEEWGGNLTFNSYQELETAFVNKELHPADLKRTVGLQINILLEPVRKHFESGRAKELLEKVRGFTVTR